MSWDTSADAVIARIRESENAFRAVALHNAFLDATGRMAEYEAWVSTRDVVQEKSRQYQVGDHVRARFPRCGYETGVVVKEPAWWPSPDLRGRIAVRWDGLAEGPHAMSPDEISHIAPSPEPVEQTELAQEEAALLAAARQIEEAEPHECDFSRTKCDASGAFVCLNDDDLRCPDHAITRQGSPG